MQRLVFRISLFVVAALLPGPLLGIEIVVDYTFDSRGFFEDTSRREAVEEVAARFSRVITTELAAVGPILDLGPPTPWRIGFEHPGTGEEFQLSTAASSDSDPIIAAGGPAANVYGFGGLNENEWTIYVGGRPLPSAGVGGTATGINFNTVFDDLDGPLHRGVFPNSTTDTAGDLPAWGGAVSFDENEQWHFDVASAAPNGFSDFYTIALHEMAHALGISSPWNQWTQHIDESGYSGSNALDALNADNNSSFTSISLTADTHWEDGVYQSKIFQPGGPITVGTVGNGLQDLLLEPAANFSTTQRRLELTNVDAAALVDIGWSILPAITTGLDLNGDGFVNASDVDLACSAGSSVAPYYEELNSLRGDINLDGSVNFLDFLALSTNFGSDDATYSTGDLNCDTVVNFNDFLTLSTEFGSQVSAFAVPEPSSASIALLLLFLSSGYRRRHANS